MSSIFDITASTTVPTDLAKKIGINGVNEILKVLWQGYYMLINDNKINISINMDEDDITIEWFYKIQLIWGSRNRTTSVVLNKLIPVHKQIDNTMKKRKGIKAPEIDFCFKDWDTSCYFGAEAKNVYDKKPEKIKRYVETGVNYYITGKYGSQSTESAIIGYALSGDISDIVERLKKELQKERPIANISRVMTITEPQYKSQHKRIFDNQEITVHHLFFNFT